MLYKTGADQRVIGVVSGYWSEPSMVHSIEVIETPTSARAQGQKNVPTRRKIDVVDANTGIIVAFNVEIAVRAIRRNPVGLQVPDPDINGRK